MILRFLPVVGLVGLLIGACGDGPDTVEVTPPPRVPAPQQSPAPSQGGFFVIPCGADQFVETTPRLPYKVDVTDDDDGLISLEGVLISACMGVTGQDKMAATEVLGLGIQAWLEVTYPKGKTEKNQEAFKAKVCTEVVRLIGTKPVLSRVTWVSLATYGTFTLELKPVTGRETPPPTPGNYSDPGCKLPLVGPTA